jgi:hypothetical protein
VVRRAATAAALGLEFTLRRRGRPPKKSTSDTRPELPD